MAADSFTAVIHRTWGGRIAQSIGGVVFGVVLLVAAFPVLVWNEGRALQTARSLEEGASTVVSVDAGYVNPLNEGRLVHVSGTADTREKLRDAKFGISVKGMRLIRTVEMYQWRERSESKSEKQTGGGTKTTTTYHYDRVWSNGVVPSDGFHKPAGHENPSAKRYGGVSFDDRTVTAKRVTLGDFELPDAIVSRLGDGERLPFDESVLENLPTPIKSGATPAGEHLYLGGDPAAPEIGDIRVSYRRLGPTVVSVVAKQFGKTFVPYPTDAGDDIQLVRLGNYPAPTMFQSAQSSNTMLTWILRVAGTLMMMVGFALVLKPLSVVADVLPILGAIVGAGAGLAALLVGAALSFLTIAIAWIAYRPLIAVGLVATAAGALFAVKWLCDRRRPVERASVTGSGGATLRSTAAPAGPAGPLGSPQALLMRAMITAALADGVIDDREHSKIIRQAQKAGLSSSASKVLETELAHPWTMERIVSACQDSKLKMQVYAASLFAIDASGSAERKYLRALARSLGLSQQNVIALHKKFGG